MKAAGIIRNVDSLGRLVLPKELRKTYGISEYDPIEIFTTDDGCIVLKKYAINDEITDTVRHLETCVNAYGHSLPGEVAASMKNHISEMKKLLDQK